MTLHPEVIYAVRTSLACPEQWEGTLTGNRKFYFRYRFGIASLKVWPEGRPDRAARATVACGDGLQGIFDEDFQREGTFRGLMKLIEQGQKEAGAWNG